MEKETKTKKDVKKNSAKKATKKEKLNITENEIKKAGSKKFVPKSGKLPGWAIVLIIISSFLIMLFYIVFFAFMIYAIDEENETYNDCTEMNCDYNENITKNFTISPDLKQYYDSNNKAYVIEGTITNNTNKEFDDVEIEYYLYDVNNVILSTARAYIEEIKPNEKWVFRAMSDDDIKQISNYKLIKIIEYADYDKYDDID